MSRQSKQSEFFDCADQRLNALSGAETAWGNFGDWSQATDYPAACEALARELADSIGLDATDRLLDLGFGMGEQLRFWQGRYGVREITGCNLSSEQTAWACAQPWSQSMSLHCASAEKKLPSLMSKGFDVVLALDCAYHFELGVKFYSEVSRVLRPDGRLAMHVLVLPSDQTAFVRRGIRHLARFMQIPAGSLSTQENYQSQLQSAGFIDIEQRDLTAPVVLGFANWWKRNREKLPKAHRRKYDIVAGLISYLAGRQQLTYCLVTARRAG